MIHEFIEILKQAIINQQQGIKSVLVTLVALEGSSYRKPGVRMLVSEDNNMVGAVSGGCIEKEICNRSQSVFENGIPKVMTYDGRYRLGCEGMLHILLEPFELTSVGIDAFFTAIKKRTPITIHSYFIKEDNIEDSFGSKLLFENGQQITISKKLNIDHLKNITCFKQKMMPPFRLLLIGGEHDAVKLSLLAANVGWQVDVITSIKDPKTAEDFPRATTVTAACPATVNFNTIDEQTAIVLMTHSFVKDLQYLSKLTQKQPAYIGVLGAAKKRERLFNDLLEYNNSVSELFLERIHTPAGLNIGAETPEEIALSILAEIIAVTNKKTPYSLKEVTGKIHSS